MTIKDVAHLPNGIYEILFTDGSSSLASIGHDNKGKPWFAATNWTGSAEEASAWKQVKSLRRVVLSSPVLPV